MGGWVELCEWGSTEYVYLCSIGMSSLTCDFFQCEWHMEIPEDVDVFWLTYACG